MADTSAMTLIESKTLTAAASSIEFINIPQDGTDLVLLCSLRTTRSGADIEDSVKLEFNNSTSNYSFRQLRGNGSENTPISASASNSLFLQNQNSDSVTANTFSSNSVYVANYTAAVAKSVSVDSVSERDAGFTYQNILAGLWNDTTAISSIKLTANVGPNLTAGCTVSLYKVTKGTDGLVSVS
jgi:hypothetical protein